jgi:hypothetical protein
MVAGTSNSVGCLIAMSKEDDKQAEIYKAFNDAVNMTPAALEKFLETEESKAVGWKGDDGKGSGESVGHKSGKRILEIKRKKKAELTDDDYAHMAKVVGYVKRHMAQGPANDVEHSKWRYSLMNWGHDPLKK